MSDLSLEILHLKISLKGKLRVLLGESTGLCFDWRRSIVVLRWQETGRRRERMCERERSKGDKYGTGRGKQLLSSMFGHGYIVSFSVAFGMTHPEGEMGHFSALKDLECKYVFVEVCM